MNLCVVMPSGKLRGGAEEALLQFVAHRRRAAIRQITVVCLERGDLPDALRALGAQVAVIDAGRLREPWKWLRAVATIRKILQRDHVDIVLAWMTKGHLYGGPAGRQENVPSVYFQMALPDNGIVDRLSRWIPAQGAVACSRFAADAQAAKTRVPVWGIPLAADLARFDPAHVVPREELRVRFGLPPDRPIVGIIGRLQHWKGMHVFAEAIALVRQIRPDVLGLIVGGAHDLEPDYEAILRRRILELGQKDGIRMVGKQSNIPEWMTAMDVIVHASDREPFGIVVVEAMALGKPVIAAKPGGPTEIIDEGVDGLLTPYGDVGALVAAILRFLDDPGFAARCGAAARTKAQEFSPERFAQRVGAAIRKLTGVRS